MEKSKFDSIVKRLAASVVMAPLTLLCIYAGVPYFNLFVLFLGCLLAWEWAEMVPSRSKSLYVSIYCFALGASVWLLHLAVVPLAIAAATLVAVYKSRGEKHRALLILGAPYIALGLGAFSWLYTIGGGMETVMWYVLLIWSVDVGGYVVGSTVKGPKLAPKISPNKTWAGLLGGMALAALTTFLFVYILNVPPFWRNSLLIASPFIAVLAQVGDLIESAIKRRLKLKDSSHLIPGHGGVFDRIDGLIFAAPFVLVFMVVLFFIQIG